MTPNRPFFTVSRQQGLSLIELGLVMVLISLALVPVVKMVGGANSSDGTGNASRVSGLKSKEAILANTMLEKVMSGDFTSFQCDGSGSAINLNPSNDLPKNGTSKTFNVCKSSLYNTPLYYQWTVLHLNEDNNGRNLPDKNNYYQASINIMDKASGGKTLLTLPTYFFYNEGAPVEETNKTGIILALDSSGSMEEAAKGSGNKGQISNATAPWMYYRYDSSQWTKSPSKLLDIWDNSQLDLVYGKQIGNLAGGGFQYPPDPDTNTPFNEAWPYAGKGSFPATGGLLYGGDCTQTASNAWNTDPLLQDIFPNNVWNNNTKRNAINAICSVKTNTTDWENEINQNLPRIEATRTAAVSLLINMESNVNIVPNIQMGYLDWDDSTQLKVPMEAAQSIGGGIHFRKMREQLLWLNRIDQKNPGSSRTIRAEGSTRIDLAMRAAVAELNTKSFNRRMMILMTDGEPNPNSGDNSKTNLVKYAKKIGLDEPDPQKQVTIFTVGLIEADKNLMEDIAYATPYGQAFIADSITDLGPIFEQITYEAQKITLLNLSKRYGMNF